MDTAEAETILVSVTNNGPVKEEATMVDRTRLSGICPAHGSWVSATAEGCPTCVMLTQGRYCARHLVGGTATAEKCGVCVRVEELMAEMAKDDGEERACILCRRTRRFDRADKSRTCVGCRVVTRSSDDEDHPSPRDESWTERFNSEQAL